MVREIILDTETTGLDPRSGHRIIEIGALEMKNKVLTNNKFHYLINPERDVPEEAYRIHGISTEHLQGKPLFKDIAEEFLEFIKGAQLVIHNAPFDLKFLNYELNLLNLPSLRLEEVVDTLVLARRTFPGTRVNLDALCRRYKIDNSKREKHGALIDAELLSEVYVELTGGRQSKFSISAQKQEFDDNSNVSATMMRGNGLVITPTQEESSRHADFMKKIIG